MRSSRTVWKDEIIDRVLHMVKKNTKKGSLIIILKENMLIEKLSCDIELFNLCFLVSPISLKAQSNNIKQLKEELRTIRLYNVESKMDKVT